VKFGGQCAHNLKKKTLRGDKIFSPSPLVEHAGQAAMKYTSSFAVTNYNKNLDWGSGMSACCTAGPIVR